MNEADSLTNEEDNFESQNYMACIAHGSIIGLSYFDANTNQVYIGQMNEDFFMNDFPCIQMVKYQIQPKTIFTSSKCDESFILALKKPLEADEKEYDVKIVKSSYFNFEQAKYRLLFLSWHGMPQGLSTQQKFILLSSIIDFSNQIQVKVLGGLLSILQQELILDHANREKDENDCITVGGISQLSFDNFLTIDYISYKALQIFSSDKHPSFMNIGKSKEGLSVFGVLNKCVSQYGRRMLRLWLLKPIIQMDVINDRMDSISFFLAFPEMMNTLLNSLKNIKDVPKLLKKFHSPSFFCCRKDWFNLLESVNSLLEIKRSFEYALLNIKNNTNLEKLSITNNVFEYINDDIKFVQELICGVIDFDQICGNNFETIISYGICEKLDELKNTYENLPDFLIQVAENENELNFHPDDEIESISVVYIPQTGYFLRIGGNHITVKNIEISNKIEFMFQGNDSNGSGYFFKTQKTKELDVILGDLYNKILDMESTIIRDLQTKILEKYIQIFKAFEVSAEIDCLISLSICAKEFNLSRPSLVEENLIQIQKGRHLLQEMTVDNFIPNDTNFNDNDRIFIITGPNYSGKSIYAKQVALIIFLAHIGSFVPAESATIGLCDRIFTRIVSRESISMQESTFVSDVKQMSMMVNHATMKSFCIIDEFGKGTLTADGIGLLCACINHFSSHTTVCPKVIVCTHYSEVFDDTILNLSPNIIFQTMSILNNKEKEIIFLYSLCKGKSMDSFGIHCAEMAGVLAEVIRRAKYLQKRMKQGIPIERNNSKSILKRDEKYKCMVDQLLSFDCMNGDLDAFLNQLFSSQSLSKNLNNTREE